MGRPDHEIDSCELSSLYPIIRYSQNSDLSIAPELRAHDRLIFWNDARA